MGIASKCFEILENRRSSSSSEGFDGRPESRLGLNDGNAAEDEDAGAGSDDDDDDDAGEDDDESMEVGEGDTESDEDEDEDGDAETDSESGSTESGRVVGRLRLREILFYDDKVAVFKARHGRL